MIWFVHHAQMRLQLEINFCIKNWVRDLSYQKSVSNARHSTDPDPTNFALELEDSIQLQIINNIWKNKIIEFLMGLMIHWAKRANN